MGEALERKVPVPTASRRPAAGVSRRSVRHMTQTDDTVIWRLTFPEQEGGIGVLDAHKYLDGILYVFALAALDEQLAEQVGRMEVMYIDAGRVYVRMKHVDDLGNIIRWRGSEEAITDLLQVADQIQLLRISYNSPLEIIFGISAGSLALSAVVHRAMVLMRTGSETRLRMAESNAERARQMLRKDIYEGLRSQVYANVGRPLPDDLVGLVDVQAMKAAEMLAAAKIIEGPEAQPDA